jgi:hypothetical protein
VLERVVRGAEHPRAVGDEADDGEDDEPVHAGTV